MVSWAAAPPPCVIIGGSARRLCCSEMSDLWPRIEPLLARVEKPARYIGMEMGTEPGNLAPRHGSGRAAFLLIYPDTYEIGLPNQGLQILYELLNERDDSVAERAYAPWTDMESSMRAAKVPLFSVDTHRAAADFDVLAFNLSAELVYTNLLNLVDLAGVPVRNEDRAPVAPDRRSPAVTARTTPSRSPSTSTPSSSATAKRSSPSSPRSSARGSAAAARRAKPCCASSPRSPASTCRRSTTSSTTARSSVDHAALSRRPRGRRQAHRRRPRRVAVPEEAARAARRGGARPAERRDLPRAARGAVGSARRA